SANAAETAKRISAAGGLADSIEVDIGDYRAAEGAVSAWIAKSGAQRIGTVLAAAVLGGTGPLIDTDLATWDLAYRVGVLGNLAVVKALLPRMLEAQFGRIAGFAGGGSAYANPTFPAYSAAKTAMVRAIENI